MAETSGSRPYPAGDPLGDSLRGWAERHRRWVWVAAAVAVARAVVVPIDDRGVDARSIASALLGATFWVLVFWPAASRLDRDRTTLWRGVTLGWTAFVLVWVGSVAVAIVHDRFRPTSVITVVIALLLLATHAWRWRRTAQGLPYRPDPEQVRARREERERRRSSATD